MCTSTKRRKCSSTETSLKKQGHQGTQQGHPGALRKGLCPALVIPQVSRAPCRPLRSWVHTTQLAPRWVAHAVNYQVTPQRAHTALPKTCLHSTQASFHSAIFGNISINILLMEVFHLNKTVILAISLPKQLSFRKDFFHLSVLTDYPECSFRIYMAKLYPSESIRKKHTGTLSKTPQVWCYPVSQ